MRARSLSALFFLLSISSAAAQSVPTWLYQGSVPTVSQWQSGFAGKQNTLGYTPVNKAGDSMNGPFILAPSTNASSGLTIQQGLPPASPINGNTWMTDAGLFYRANGVTYGPITGTVNCAAMPAFSGAISSTAGTCTTAFSATVPIANGGTGQTSSAAALAALGGAPLASPTFTGTPIAPTPGTSDNTTKIATTAFVKAQAYLTSCPSATDIAKGCMFAPATPPVVHQFLTTYDGSTWLAARPDCTDISDAVSTCNSLASPAFTGTPTAPTPLTADNSTTLATTAFVKAQSYATTSFVTSQGYAPLASPTFTGVPLSTTPTTGDNTTKIATTAFVKAQAYAPLASPGLTGVPTAPTAADGTNTTQLATTQFVQSAIGGTGAVSSVFGRTGAVVAVANDYNFNQLAGTAAVAQGGTGSGTAAGARSNLAVPGLATANIFPANQTFSGNQICLGFDCTTPGSGNTAGILQFDGFDTFTLNYKSGALHTAKLSMDALTLATDLTVANGGTGAGTFASNGVLYGNGTSALQALAVNSTATNKYLRQVSSGAPSWQQIAAADITGFAAIATSGSASDLVAGTVPASRIPNPSATTLGGIESYSAISHKWINTISTSGVPSSTQPAFTDISGTLASAQCPAAVSGGAIGCMFAPASPTPVHQFLNSYNGTAWGSAQVDFSDLSGTLASSQFGPLTGDVTTSGYAATLAKINGVTASRVVAVNGSNVPTGSFASSVLGDSLTDETGYSSGALAVFSISPTFTGTINAVNLATTGPITSTNNISTSSSGQSIYINNGAGLYAIKKASVSRWVWGGDGSIETGGNAGTNYYLGGYADDGTYLGDYIDIIRATGVANFPNGLQSGGSTVLKASNTGTSGHTLPYLDGNNTFSGTDIFSSSLKAGADFYWTNPLTPPAISARADNYSPAGMSIATVLRFSCNTTGLQFTGLATGAEGRFLLLQNAGSATCNLVNQSGLSSAANRMELGGSDIAVLQNMTVLLKYDATLTRWVRIGGSQLPFPSVTQLGGIYSQNCATGALYVQGVISDGTLNCNPIVWSSITSTPTTLAGYGITDALVTTSNLSDVQNPVTASNNLGHWHQVLSADVSKTANNSFAGLTDFQVAAVSGKRYSFDALLQVSADATNGMRFRMGGTASASSTGYSVSILCVATKVFDGVVYSTSWSTGAPISDTTCTSAIVRISGTVTASSTGNLTVQWAQAATTNPSGVTTILSLGSFFNIDQVN